MATFRRGWERRLAVAGVRHKGGGEVGWGEGEKVEIAGTIWAISTDFRRLRRLLLPLIDPSPRNRASFLSTSAASAKNPRERPPAPTRVRQTVAHQVVDTVPLAAPRPLGVHFPAFFFIPRPASPFPLIVGREGDRSPTV